MRILTGALSEYYHNEFVQAAEELGIELMFVDPAQINIIFLILYLDCFYLTITIE